MELKYKILIGVILLILGIIAVIIKYDPTPQFNLKETGLSQLKLNLTPEKDYQAIIKPYTDLDFISDLAFNNSISRTYELNVYDCTDFSKELVKRLKEIGIKSECTSGYYLLDIPHTWVSVWLKNGTRLEIESTSGYIIDDDTYKKDYSVEWEGKCW